MTCAEVERLLLEDPEAIGRSELETHLVSCVNCRELHRQLQEIEELNRDLARSSGAPLGFSCKIVSEVSRRRRWPALGPLAVVLVGLTLLGAGLRWSQRLSDTAVASSSIRQHPTLPEALPMDFEGGFRAVGIDDPTNPAGSSYREVVISEPSGRSYIVRVPSTIEIRRNDLTQGRLVKLSH